MEMKAIRLDYCSAAASKWEARGAPAPNGLDSEWKRTAPPHPLESPSTAALSPTYHMHNKRKGPEPSSLLIMNHSEPQKRHELFTLSADPFRHPHKTVVHPWIQPQRSAGGVGEGSRVLDHQSVA